MQKKDLYLSEEELIRAELMAGWKEIPHYRDEEWGEYYHDAKRAISKTAANSAVKTVVREIEWINHTREGFIDFNSRVLELCEALKKLIEA